MKQVLMKEMFFLEELELHCQGHALRMVRDRMVELENQVSRPPSHAAAIKNFAAKHDWGELTDCDQTLLELSQREAPYAGKRKQTPGRGGPKNKKQPPGAGKKQQHQQQQQFRQQRERSPMGPPRFGQAQGQGVFHRFSR